MKNNTKNNTARIASMAMFTALAFVATLATSWIKVDFLSFDAKDAVITIAAFIYGPLSAVTISFIVAIIEFLTISSTGWYGLIMNIASSVVFSLTASLIYKFKRNINGALIGFAAAVVATTGVMLALNVLVTPFYLAFVGVPKEVANETVIDMLASVLLPFNFAKALMNAAISMYIYKPVTLALRRAKLIDAKGDGSAYKFNSNSVKILVIGGVAIVASIAVFLVLLSRT